MKTLSRREFLQLSSIVLVGSQFDGLPFLHSMDTNPVMQGRALSAAPIYRAPAQGEVIGRLWPDSITTVSGVERDWYRVPAGYVARAQIQPMKVYQPQPVIQPPATPLWAEVSAPVAAVRQSCAADAPLVTRIGHGGVARIVDFLPGEPNGWYGIGHEDDALIGWSQAVFWQPVATTSVQAGDHHLEIDSRMQRLSAWGNGQLILEAPFSAGRSLKTGQYPILTQTPGVYYRTESQLGRMYGVPWVTYFGGYQLAGAYWHNQFGDAQAGPAVQVAPYLAEWLYGWLNGNSRIEIV